MNIPSTTESAPTLSIVSPVYRAGPIVGELIHRIHQTLKSTGISYEIILVDDYSPDNSWEKIATCVAQDSSVRGVKLSRNFGQHAAITAGLAHSKGQHIVVMDCDLQDDPKYIPQMLELAEGGYDIVFTCKRKRAHSTLKNICAHIFNWIFNWLSDSVTSRSDIGSFSLISRKVVREFLRLKDTHRHYLMLLRWLGFPSTYLTIEHAERFEGESSYSFRRLVSHAIDGITSQSTKLLRLAISVGMFFFLSSLILAAAIIGAYFVYGFKEGWASVVVMQLLSTGIILCFLGVIGIYLGKTFEQSKGKPLFVVERLLNFETEEGRLEQHSTDPVTPTNAHSEVRAAVGSS